MKIFEFHGPWTTFRYLSANHKRPKCHYNNLCVKAKLANMARICFHLHDQLRSGPSRSVGVETPWAVSKTDLCWIPIEKQLGGRTNKYQQCWCCAAVVAAMLFVLQSLSHASPWHTMIVSCSSMLLGAKPSLLCSNGSHPPWAACRNVLSPITDNCTSTGHCRRNYARIN